MRKQAPLILKVAYMRRPETLGIPVSQMSFAQHGTLAVNQGQHESTGHMYDYVHLLLVVVKRILRYLLSHIIILDTSMPKTDLKSVSTAKPPLRLAFVKGFRNNRLHIFLASRLFGQSEGCSELTILGISRPRNSIRWRELLLLPSSKLST